MINTSDIRRGNLFIDKVTRRILVVDGITCGDIVFDFLDKIPYPLPNGWQAEPIPLTPDVLLKCGFVKNNDFYCLDHRALRDMDIKATEYNGAWSAYLHKANWQNSTRCFYLHSLMNLYHALTGEELKYQP